MTISQIKTHPTIELKIIYLDEQPCNTLRTSRTPVKLNELPVKVQHLIIQRSKYLTSCYIVVLRFLLFTWAKLTWWSRAEVNSESYQTSIVSFYAKIETTLTKNLHHICMIGSLNTVLQKEHHASFDQVNN